MRSRTDTLKSEWFLQPQCPLGKFEGAKTEVTILFLAGGGMHPSLPTPRWQSVPSHNSVKRLGGPKSYELETRTTEPEELQQGMWHARSLSKVLHKGSLQGGPFLRAYLFSKSLVTSRTRPLAGSQSRICVQGFLGRSRWIVLYKLWAQDLDSYWKVLLLDLLLTALCVGVLQEIS